MACLGTPSIEMAGEGFKPILFFQPSQLWSLDFILHRVSILTEKYLPGVTVTTLVVKG